jgi:hypothetical protein
MEQEPKYAVRLNIKNLSYKAEHILASKRELDDIMKFLLSSRKDIVLLLTRRYKEMKEAGNKILSHENKVISIDSKR